MPGREGSTARRARMMAALGGVLVLVGIYLWLTAAWWLGAFHVFLGVNRLARPWYSVDMVRRLRYAEWGAALVVTVAVIGRYS